MSSSHFSLSSISSFLSIITASIISIKRVLFSAFLRKSLKFLGNRDFADWTNTFSVVLRRVRSGFLKSFGDKCLQQWLFGHNSLAACPAPSV